MGKNAIKKAKRREEEKQARNDELQSCETHHDLLTVAVKQIWQIAKAGRINDQQRSFEIATKANEHSRKLNLGLAPGILDHECRMALAAHGGNECRLVNDYKMRV